MMCTKACAAAPLMASSVPTPIPTTMKPSWLLSEKDNTLRRSFSTTAKKTGKAVMMAPIQISSSVPA